MEKELEINTIKNREKGKFFSFFKLMNFFKFKSINHKKLELEVDAFLKIELIDDVSFLIENGYELTKKQKNLYIKIFNDKFNKEGIVFLEKALNKNNYIPNDFIFNFLLNRDYPINYTGFKNDIELKNYPKILEYIYISLNTREKTLSFLNDALKKYNKEYKRDLSSLKNFLSIEGDSGTINYIKYYKLSHDESIKKIITAYIPNLLENLKREDILNILLELTPKVSQFEKIMTKAERRLRIYCREDIKHIINYQSKNSFYAKNNKVNSESISEIDVYLNNLRDLINSEFSKENNDYLLKLSNIIENPLDNIKFNEILKSKNSDDIPDLANTLLDKIQKDIKYCLEHEKDLTPDELYRVKKFIDFDVSEIITKYITIHPDYRTSFLHISGKNAEQLMLESLNEISKHLNTYIESINSNKINELSVTNRKMKMYN